VVLFRSTCARRERGFPHPSRFRVAPQSSVTVTHLVMGDYRMISTETSRLLPTPSHPFDRESDQRARCRGCVRPPATALPQALLGIKPLNLRHSRARAYGVTAASVGASAGNPCSQTPSHNRAFAHVHQLAAFATTVRADSVFRGIARGREIIRVRHAALTFGRRRCLPRADCGRRSTRRWRPMSARGSRSCRNTARRPGRETGDGGDRRGRLAAAAELQAGLNSCGHTRLYQDQAAAADDGTTAIGPGLVDAAKRRRARDVWRPNRP
jgi:hypothetical protein